MEFFDKILFQLQDASKKQFEQYVMFFLLGVMILIGGMIYFIDQKKGALRTEISRLYILSNQVIDVLEKNKRIMADELLLKNAIEKRPNFTLMGFFESFCKEQNAPAEPGWDSRTESINERFDEVVLPVTFKGFSMERFVQLLSVLDKEALIYIKEAVVKVEQDKKLSFTLTLATSQLKSQFT